MQGKPRRAGSPARQRITPQRAALAAYALSPIQITDSVVHPHFRSRFFSWVIFLLPALALTMPIGAGVVELTVALAALYYAKPLWLQRSEFFKPAQLIIIAFALNLAVALASVAWFGGKFSNVENPLRQLVVAAAIGLVVLTRPKAEWFWYGLFAGAFGAAVLAFYQRFGLHLERAGGFHQIIMFGDIAMAMALMSLAAIQTFSKTRWALLPYVGFFSGVCASVLSGTRGGWIALVLAFIPLYSYGRRSVGRKVVVVAAAGAMLLVAACFVPQAGVAERITAVSQEIELYRQGNIWTSIGTRFQVWTGAWTMFVEHPLFGVGRANFNPALNELIARGDINPAMNGFFHAHNEMLHALATQGVVGAITLLLLYALPFVFFMRCLRRGDSSQPYALAGLLLVLAFTDFGLTQVLFAHHIGAAFYALTVSTLAGICITQRASQTVHHAA
jgi:O-antigen ligase